MVWHNQPPGRLRLGSPRTQIPKFIIPTPRSQRLSLRCNIVPFFPLEIMSALSSALNASWEATAWVSLLLGVVTHLSIRPFEIDSRAWPLLFSYLGVLATLAVSFVTTAGFKPLDSLLRTFIVAGAFNVGLGGSILLYRAFFHRLHRFPGPFPAKLSRFYAMTKAAKNLQANIDIQNLHARYGDFVRVGKISRRL